MILKKHLMLNSRNMNQTMYLAILGLATLPISSLANHHPHHSAPAHTAAATTPAKHHNTIGAPKIGGKAGFNYTFDDTGANSTKHARKYGDWKFNKFLLNLTGEAHGLDYKVEHLWYNGNNSNYYHFLETYVGHKFKNNVIGQIGNTMVPFGISDNFSWWKNIAFYSGFGDNYDTGIKMIYNECPWGFQLQLGKNNIVSGNNAFAATPKLTTGTPNSSSSTGTTSTPNLNQNNEDSTQLVARVVRMHHINDHAKVEVGLSGKVGNTYNTVSMHRGTNVAGAIHVNAHVDRWQIQLQFLPYGYSPNNGTGVGAADGAMQMGKDGYVYTIPSKANIYTAGIAYNIPVNWGKIENITVYDDYSQLSGKRTLRKTRMNIIGAKFETGPLYVIADVITAKNMFGIGQDLDANGNLNIFNIGSNNPGLDGADHWRTKININFGVKF